MVQLAAAMPIYSMLYPLVNVPAHPPIVTTLKYFNEAGVIGMSHNFKKFYVGLAVGEKGPSVLALIQLNWEYSELTLVHRLGNKAGVSITEFVSALSANRRSKERIIGHVRGIGGNHHLCTVVATYMEGFLTGWNADVRSIMDKSHWSMGSKFVIRA